MDDFSPHAVPDTDDQYPRFEERTGESRPAVGEDAVVALHIQVLNQLLEIGLAVAGAIGRVATGQSGPAETKAFAGVDLALGFSRVAKAMGQITLLTQETLKLRETRRSAARAQFRRERKAAAEGAVREIAAKSPATAGSGAMPGQAKISLRDLFLRYDDYDDYCKGAFEEVVARICRDLGVTPDPEMLKRVAEGRNVDPAPPPPPLTRLPDWTFPPNPKVAVVEKPYTVRTTADGTRVWVPLDSPHLKKDSQAPP